MINDWSLMKKLIWLRGSPVSGGSGAWNTISGAIVEFITQRAHKLKSCVVNMEPQQDLHGYDSPWPEGGGRNLLNIADATVGSDWLIHNITDSIRLGQAFYASATITNLVGNIQIQVEYLKDGTRQYIFGNLVSSASGKLEVSGTIQSFDANTRVNLVLKNQTSATVSNYFMTYSSDHSYAPYSNICPISGWTGCEVTHTGTNLFNPAAMLSGSFYTVNADGTITVTSPDWRDWNSIADFPLPSGTYTISMPEGAGTSELRLSSDGFNYVYRFSPGTPYTFTLSTKGSAKLKLSAIGATYPITCKVELVLGTAVQLWETYNGNSHSVTFGETVYGAKPDIITGEMPITMNEIDFGAVNWGAGFGGFYTSSLKNLIKIVNSDTVPNMLCSVYKTVKYTASSNKTITQIWGGEGYEYNGYVLVKNSDYTTAEEFKTAMTGQKIVYELATPVDTTITPVPVTALKGYNAVWSDAGDIEVTVHGTPVEVGTLQALNMLLGGAYRNDGTADDVSDEEALDIILGGEQR